MTKCWYAYYCISLCSKYTKSIQYDCQKRVCDRFTEVKQRKGTRNGCFFLFLSSSFFYHFGCLFSSLKLLYNIHRLNKKALFYFFLFLSVFLIVKSIQSNFFDLMVSYNLLHSIKCN